MQISLAAHPLLCAAAFRTRFAGPLGARPVPAEVLARLALDVPAPVTRSDELRAAVRDLLRHAGYKPTGRGKPSSEYLVRAAGEGALGSINLAVDACNAVSLASGLPISVIDPERARAPFRIGVAPAHSSYVFNAGGQEIDVSGLLCLFDADGPCANAVKDAQRTKTTPETATTLSIVWGPRGFEEHVARTAGWYREILASAGNELVDVDLVDG